MILVLQAPLPSSLLPVKRERGITRYIVLYIRIFLPTDCMLMYRMLLNLVSQTQNAYVRKDKNGPTHISAWMWKSLFIDHIIILDLALSKWLSGGLVSGKLQMNFPVPSLFPLQQESATHPSKELVAHVSYLFFPPYYCSYLLPMHNLLGGRDSDSFLPILFSPLCWFDKSI